MLRIDDTACGGALTPATAHLANQDISGRAQDRNAVTLLHSFSFVMAALVAAISLSNALLLSSGRPE
jgi:hypothetical protein